MEVASKFLTKLWNVCRFISSFPQPRARPKLSDLDKWITGELDKLTGKCLEGYKEFNFFIPANAVREFVWNIFAPHYLEMAKARAYGSVGTKAEQEAARHTLHRCLKTILTLLAPILPFITDHVYRELYSRKGVHRERLPKPGKPGKLPFTTEDLVDLNSRIWKAKKDRGLSLRTGIKAAALPRKFKSLEQDLRNTHSIKEVKWWKELQVSF